MTPRVSSKAASSRIAAVNSHRLCVLSGPLEAIARAEARCAEQEIPARRLGYLARFS